MALSSEEVLAGVAELINEEFDIAPELISAEKSLTDDLNLDSLDLATIVKLAEDKFEITISDDDLSELVTVGNVVDYVVKAQA